MIMKCYTLQVLCSSPVSIVAGLQSHLRERKHAGLRPEQTLQGHLPASTSCQVQQANT